MYCLEADLVERIVQGDGGCDKVSPGLRNRFGKSALFIYCLNIAEKMRLLTDFLS